MELKGKKVAVFVETLYQELEAWYPILRLREAGAEVFTVGPQAGATYESKLGYPIRADRGVDQVKVSDFDALVIPGGFAPDYMRRSPAFVRLVAEADREGKPVAAICHAVWMFCSARILKGRRVTCFFSIKDDVMNAGAEYIDQEVVIDRNLITSRKPDDLPAFCRAIIDALCAVAEPAGVGAAPARG